jgi:hypothetical protein
MSELVDVTPVTTPLQLYDDAGGTSLSGVLRPLATSGPSETGSDPVSEHLSRTLSVESTPFSVTLSLSLSLSLFLLLFFFFFFFLTATI